MKTALALLWCSTLFAGDAGKLQSLTDKHRFFDLRRELEQPGSNPAETLFYRADIASRFGHETEGIERFRQFLAANPSPDQARAAHEEIAAAFTRLCRYADAVHAWDEALDLTPAKHADRQGNENSRALMSALSDVPPESVDLVDSGPIQATRNPLGSWNVPVQVNGSAGQWIFDTGANFSTLSESEAKRMRLTIRQTKTYVNGSTGKRNALQLAVASDLQIGAAHVHNVIFLVIADPSLYIPPLHYQIAGILGLPVLRALGRVAISNTGAAVIRPAEAATQTAPNLFFDGADPILDADHNQHHLQMFLDTGANASVLYRDAFDAIGREKGLKLQTKREHVAGAGKVIKRKMEFLPTFEIELTGKPLTCRT